MSARLNRPVISGPTWISLTLADVAIWVIAEVQHSAGSLRTAFDAVWLASFLGFILLLTNGWTRSHGPVAATRATREPRATRRAAARQGCSSPNLTAPPHSDQRATGPHAPILTSETDEKRPSVGALGATPPYVGPKSDEMPITVRS